MEPYAKLWKRELAARRFRARPAFTEDGVVYGLDTILLEVGGDTHGSARRDRLVALLAVADCAPPHADAVLQIEAAARDWRYGDKAVAAIRLAFAPVAKLADLEAAYRLFLAEQALQAGLDLAAVLREFGLDRVVDLSKYSRDQPRVPQGSGRASGQFGNKPGAASSDAIADDESHQPTVADDSAATVQPVFFDPQHSGKVEPPDAPFFETTHHFKNPNLKEESLDPLPFLLPLVPFFFPSTKTKTEDDENGPDCPVMRPDRSMIGNPAGDAEEARVARLINPEDPTPKRIPGHPLSFAMAYYLNTKVGTGEVEYDDCKRTNTPALVIGMKKGGMAEIKTAQSAWLIWQDFSQGKDGAGPRFDSQIDRQVTGVNLENKGRQIFYCVGTQENVDRLEKRYAGKPYFQAHFLVCR